MNKKLGVKIVVGFGLVCITIIIIFGSIKFAESITNSDISYVPKKTEVLFSLPGNEEEIGLLKHQIIDPTEIAVIDATDLEATSWTVHPQGTVFEIDSNGMIVYVAGKPGEYYFFCSKSDISSFHVTVTGKVPSPVDPDDPIPNPIDPPVIKPPFDTDNLCVLIVHESANTGKLTVAQRTAIYSTTVQKYIKDQKGDFALVDPDSPLEKESAWVEEAMKVERDSLPWVVISNGKTGDSKPIIDLDTLLKTIKKVQGE